MWTLYDYKLLEARFSDDAKAAAKTAGVGGKPVGLQYSIDKEKPGFKKATKRNNARTNARRLTAGPLEESLRNLEARFKEEGWRLPADPVLPSPAQQKPASTKGLDLQAYRKWKRQKNKIKVEYLAARVKLLESMVDTNGASAASEDKENKMARPRKRQRLGK